MNPKLLRAYALKMGGGATLLQAQSEIISIVRDVSRSVSKGFRFGFHSDEDMEQQGALFAWQALDDGSYDPSRPLENFLHVHIRNRLRNYRRKHLYRAEHPCQCCPRGVRPESPCRRWTDWNDRNERKRHIMKTVDVSRLSDGFPSLSTTGTAEVDAQLGEALSILDRRLPQEVRSDFQRMRVGVSIPKGRRQKVREAVSLLVGHLIGAFE